MVQVTQPRIGLVKVDLLRHEDVKRRLRLAGSSLTEIARTEGVLQSTVTVVSQGYRKSHRIQKAIAEQLGIAPQQLFPDRYAQEECQETKT
ncbi:transcriptional regulator [Synechococcus moorigangaii CMS01]|nr:transcriptional regulator [Synechococcus moorigangaii CMS01]